MIIADLYRVLMQDMDVSIYDTSECAYVWCGLSQNIYDEYMNCEIKSIMSKASCPTSEIIINI